MRRKKILFDVRVVDVDVVVVAVAVGGDLMWMRA